jgi:hypothetical protein
MSGRLSSDLDATQSKRILELLSTDTNVFDGFTASDMEEILHVLKLL